MKLPAKQMGLVLATTSLLSACGGGSDDPLTAVTSVTEITTTLSSDNYKVAYFPADAFVTGKTSFRLRISDKNGSPLSGVAPSVSAMMDMTSHKHATPDQDCGVTNATGDTLCTVYFLMSSLSDKGEVQGTWAVTVTVNGEQVSFDPTVTSASGDTVRTTLKGVSSDKILSKNGETARPYYLFKDSLTSAATGYEFKLFLATQESMMSYPALKDGLLLNDATSYQLVVNSISVKVATDDSDTATWSTAVSEGKGIWAASGLTLPANQTVNLYVRLEVNGDAKTTNGEAASSSNQSAVFKLAL